MAISSKHDKLGVSTRIDQPDADKKKPVPVAFFILAYQQEHCIAECLESALAQDYPNLRIIVSDDSSSDRTSEVIRDLLCSYRGPHKTLFIQQPKNLRIHHVNALMPEFTKEPFAVMGHGDDVFHANRVSVSIRTMREEGTFSATANAIVIDEQGAGDQLAIQPDADHDLSLETLCRVSTNRACFGAGQAWRRAVFGRFGPLRLGPRQVDQIIVFRSMLLGGASLIDEPLFRYRVHKHNLNLGRVAELASESDKVLIEERRRNNVVATVVAQRELLLLARDRGVNPALDYEKLDRILLDTLYKKARTWALHRARMVDEGIGIY